jgi:glucose/arabinose dehydrogenase
MKHKPFFFPLIIIIVLSFGCSKKSESQLFIGNTPIDTNTIVTGIETPWEILWGPDNYIWFTERPGRVNRLNPETGNKQLILTIDDAFEYGEAGLLGMALHPDFSSSPWVYLVYNYTDGSAIKERLVRYIWNGSVLEQGSTLINNIPANSFHNGSRLVFGPDNKLYMSTGDAGNTSSSQNMNSLAGKILRINPDGTIPSDNPNPASYIWAFGLRNSQGLAFTPQGFLYGSEHGPNSDDEFNLLEANRNYGWPSVNGFCDLPDEITFCQANNVKEPLYAWTPTLAVAGIDYYNHAAIPEWQGSMLMVALKASKMVSLKLSADGQSVTEVANWFDGYWGRLRDVCVSPDGRVFIAVSNRDGRGTPRAGDDRIVEIVAKNTIGVNDIVSPEDEVKIFPNPVTDQARVQWASASGDVSYQILNPAGIVSRIGTATGPEFSIFTRNLNPGYYILRVISRGQSAAVPFMVM